MVRKQVEDNDSFDIPFLTAEELAEMLKVNPKTIQRMARRGDIQALRVGRQFRFRRDWVEKWLEENTLSTREKDSA